MNYEIWNAVYHRYACLFSIVTDQPLIVDLNSAQPFNGRFLCLFPVVKTHRTILSILIHPWKCHFHLQISSFFRKLRVPVCDHFSSTLQHSLNIRSSDCAIIWMGSYSGFWSWSNISSENIQKNTREIQNLDIHWVLKDWKKHFNTADSPFKVNSIYKHNQFLSFFWVTHDFLSHSQFGGLENFSNWQRTPTKSWND
jgi:hypothetical protein